MIRKRISCMSCETKSDVIIRSSNFEDDDVEIVYCPVCSASIDENTDYEEYHDYEE